MGVCDAHGAVWKSEKQISPDEGYLLDARFMQKSVIQDKLIDQAVPMIQAMGITREQYRLQIESVQGASPWLICDECIGVLKLSQADKDAAREAATKFSADKSTPGHVPGSKKKTKEKRTALEPQKLKSPAENTKKDKKASNDPLRFSVKSLKLEKKYDYVVESIHKTLTAAADYQLIIAHFQVENLTDGIVIFSSEQFHVVDNTGKKVDASLRGVGNSIAENGKVITFDSTVKDADGNKKATFRGKLSPDVSYILWELNANMDYQGTLVYVTRADINDVHLEFSNSPVSPQSVQLSRISLSFEVPERQESYEYIENLVTKKITTSEKFKFFIVKFSIKNDSYDVFKFSSMDFSLINKEDKKINASLFGISDFIAENGKVKTFQWKPEDKFGKVAAQIHGKLNPDVSFIEWELQPQRTHESILVFIIPSGEEKTKIKFSHRFASGRLYVELSDPTSGCFIASAVFPPFAPEVLWLRTFRDTILSRYKGGRLFVSCYYKYSPNIAEWIAKSNVRKQLVRSFLKLLVNIAAKSLDNRCGWKTR